MLKVWCRDRANQFVFQAVEEQCHATYAYAAHRVGVDKDRDEATRAAVQTAVRFRDGYEPDLLAGLDLEPGEPVQQRDHDDHAQQQGRADVPAQ